MAEEQKEFSLGGYSLMIYWLIIGPALLIVCAVVIGIHKIADPALLDIVYGMILLTIIAARLVDRAGRPEKQSEHHVINQNKTTRYQAKLRSALGHCAFITITAIVIWISVQ